VAINGTRFGLKEKRRGGETREPRRWRGGSAISLWGRRHDSREASHAAGALAGRWWWHGTAVGGRRPRRPTWAGVAEWVEGLGQNH
jgi:hypothetical protein